MQERVAQVPHRSGLLKQTNKKHKTGGHRSKVSLEYGKTKASLPL